MTVLAVLLILAAVGHGLAKWMRLPPVPVLIGCGMVAGASGLVPGLEEAGSLVELGIVFLVFTAGIEMSPNRFRHQTSAVFWVAATQFLVVGAAATSVAWAFGYGVMGSLLVGFALSASSTILVLRHLRMNRQFFEPFGRLVTGVLLLQDVALILIFTALVVMHQSPDRVWEGLTGMILLGGLGAVSHRWLVPALFRTFEHDDELLLLSGLAVFFGFVGLGMTLGLPVLAGALLAGVVLSTFPVNGLLRGLFGSVADFFHALFFAALGTLLFPLSWQVVGQALVFAMLVFLLTPPLVALVAEWRGQSARTGVESGLLLAQTSELGLVVALYGLQAGILDRSGFVVVGLVAALTMGITPLVATDTVAWKLTHLHPGRRCKAKWRDKKDHVLVLGLGSAGMWVVRPLLKQGEEVLVVDDDPKVVEQLVRMKIPVLRGDGSDEQTLRDAGAVHARLILAGLPRVRDILQVMRLVPGVPVVARVFEEVDAVQVRSAGGHAIMNSHAAADCFLAWLRAQPEFGLSRKEGSGGG